MVPFKGHIPPPPGIKGRGLLRYFLTPGPITRSVEDLKLILKIIAGSHENQWEVPPANLDCPAPKPLSQLRIAWCDDLGISVSSEIRAALTELAGRLSEAGCMVERAYPPDFNFYQAIQIYGLLKQAAFSVRGTPLNLPRVFWRMAANFVSDPNPIAKGLMSGAGADLKKYATALSQRDGYIEQMEKFLGNWDAWICPVAVCTAYPHVASNNIFKQLSATITVDGLPIPYILATSYYTSLFNLTGNPVVVLPLAHSMNGMPIGIQVVGRRWHDMELLNAAESLTEVTGPFKVPAGY